VHDELEPTLQRMMSWGINRAGKPRKVHSVLLEVDGIPKNDLLDPTQVSPALWFAEASQAIIQSGHRCCVEALRHLSRNVDHDDLSDSLEGVGIGIGLVHALRADNSTLTCAPALVEVLRQDHEFAPDFDLNKDPFPQLLMSLFGAIKHSASATAAGATAVSIVTAVARRAFQFRADHGLSTTALLAWADQHGVVLGTPAPGLQVLHLTVRQAEDGWTIERVTLVRSDGPERSFEDWVPRCITHGDAPPTRKVLWDAILEASDLVVLRRFATENARLVLSVDVPASWIAAGIHRENDDADDDGSLDFHAVTWWPLVGQRNRPAGGFESDGPLHRPNGADSASVVLAATAACRTGLKRRRRGRVATISARVAWTPDDAGASPAIDTHRQDTLTILLGGDDTTAFLDHQFVGADDVPVDQLAIRDALPRVRDWLDRGHDAVVLWTNPACRPADRNTRGHRFRAI